MYEPGFIAETIPGEELVTLTTARAAGLEVSQRGARAAGGARGGRRAPSVVGAAASKVACSAYVSPVVGHTPGWMTGTSDARSDIHSATTDSSGGGGVGGVGGGDGDGGGVQCIVYAAARVAAVAVVRAISMQFLVSVWPLERRRRASQ